LALPSGVYTFQADVSTATPANQIVTISRSLEWIATSGGNWAQGSNWSGGVAPTAVDDATVDLTGSYGITVSGADTVNSLLVTDPGATISISANGALAVTGTLNLNAGSLNLMGTLSGGTIVSNGGTIVLTGGTLSGVTYDGTMNLSSTSSYVYVTNGLTLAGINGTGTGTINLTGQSAYIYAEAARRLMTRP
jgi:fibronectin-binding autotransporter adhesin